MPGKKPEGLFCRRGQALAWLQISKEEFDKLEGARVICGRALRKGGRKFYLVAQLEEALLNPFTTATKRR